jgi:carbon starvation protein
VLPPERGAVAPKLIFNLHLDGWLTVALLAIVWIIVLDTARGCWLHLSGRRVAPSTESPYVTTQLA